MMGHRMSSLGTAAICPKSPLLSASHGASIEALKGQAYHALCSGDRDAMRILRSLPPDDRAEVEGWKEKGEVFTGYPRTISFKDGEHKIVLDYKDAEKELEVALSNRGVHCKADDPNCATVGHLDMAWVKELGDKRVAYIGDIKKSRWTTFDGPDTIQCIAYGFAYSSLQYCDGFTCGLYIAEEGNWQWSGKYHDLESKETMALLDLVLYAARNQGDAVTGSHCANCWGRMHCDEYLLPPALGETHLRELSTVHPGELSPDGALRALQFYKQCSDLCKQLEKTLKVYADRQGGIVDYEAKKQWVPVSCQGRESVNIDLLRQELGEKAERFIKRGPRYNQHRWSAIK